VLDGGYVDGYRSACPKGPGFTFPTWDPHVRLDYVFLPAPLAPRLRACEIVKTPDTSAASDHLPLLAELDLS
jgi:endonuclease/exonuclease/phosphatase family metal-dependent hydrolase